jgi:C4-dicarboxylate-specific signal transduction histidine kinase
MADKPADLAQRLADAEQRIVRQRAIIERLEAGGHGDMAAQAAALLRTFETVRQTHLRLAKLVATNAPVESSPGASADFHTARLALLGQLLASIAHEIQQPTAAIVANASASLLHLKRRDAPDLDELANILNDIHDEAIAISDIINRVRALARKEPLRKTTLDVTEVVEEALKLVRPEALRHKVRLRTDIAADLPKIIADRVAIEQLLLILIVNACEAFEDAKAEERVVVISAARQDGSVELAVSDTGPGIPAGTVDHLFQPFVTTKKEGLGLGLPMAKLIAEAHGGTLNVDRGNLGGALFRFVLPAAEVKQVN